VDLDRVAYFFEYEPPLPRAAYDPLRKAVAEWSAAWQSDSAPVLTYRAAPGFLQIYDTRFPGHEGVYTFHDTLADLYLACSDRPTTAKAVAARLGGTVPAVEAAFAQFQERGLMFLDGNLAVALAIPATPGH
jgi:hypothetical protein